MRAAPSCRVRLVWRKQGALAPALLTRAAAPPAPRRAEQDLARELRPGTGMSKQDARRARQRPRRRRRRARGGGAVAPARPRPPAVRRAAPTNVSLRRTRDQSPRAAQGLRTLPAHQPRCSCRCVRTAAVQLPCGPVQRQPQQQLQRRWKPAAATSVARLCRALQAPLHSAPTGSQRASAARPRPHCGPDRAFIWRRRPTACPSRQPACWRRLRRNAAGAPARRRGRPAPVLGAGGGRRAG